MSSSGDIPTGQRQALYRRSGQQCERCGRPGAEAHHRRPRGMGGTARIEVHALSNLVHLCRTCHAWVESNRDVAMVDGWLVPLGVEPAAHPLVSVYRYLLPCLLDDAGMYVLT